MGDGFCRPLTEAQTRIPPEMFDAVFGPETAPVVENGAMLEALGATDMLRFRGVTYRVAPVPFAEGQRLAILEHDLARLASAPMDEIDRLREVGAVLETTVAIFQRLAVPVGWRRLLPRRPNPFREASVREVADLRRFFSARSLASTLQSPSNPDRLSPRTARPTSPPSAIAFPRAG